MARGLLLVADIRKEKKYFSHCDQKKTRINESVPWAYHATSYS
jgi:hypothetical protein